MAIVGYFSDTIISYFSDVNLSVYPSRPDYVWGELACLFYNNQMNRSNSQQNKLNHTIYVERTLSRPDYFRGMSA